MNEFKHSDCFKEAVCIDAMRIFDSCSSQDCLEDLGVTFAPADQDIIDDALYIKCKCVEVHNVTFGIDPVPFNKGFYTVDMTYTFKVNVEVYYSTCSNPICVSGMASFDKKVILFGSDGNTKQFYSDETCQCPSVSTGCCSNNVPRAVVNVAEPICLDAKLITVCTDPLKKKVTVTIGIFAIVQLERPVPILIPAYDYCLPEKECSMTSDSPCELFEKIKFPIHEFFPKCLSSDDCECRCSDSDSN